MHKTVTTQDDHATPFPSHSPNAKQDQNKDTPPFTLTAPAPCHPSTPLPRDTTSHLVMMPAGTTYSNTASGLTDTRACERMDSRVEDKAGGTSNARRDGGGRGW